LFGFGHQISGLWPRLARAVENRSVSILNRHYPSLIVVRAVFRCLKGL